MKLSEKYPRETVGRAARRSRHCQSKAVRSEGKGGMVNVCELLINVVSLNKLKGLIGLNQKVRESVMKCQVYSSGDNVLPGK
ncbi:protein of unknown function [Acidithiobacillus ferrivorans]|uniref:Uncharacterized protein n=1 Tax=Acidithiobacillus ferrivorans TaxID=160808 RepID=A0A060UQY3_9PROT|nr:hypothetical protein AFERRI_240057 [Acidithiobacillus ferrivorans]SMH64891.1 protein of unknown function [Acidithiobacillus ferrivorans]